MARSDARRCKAGVRAIRGWTTTLRQIAVAVLLVAISAAAASSRPKIEVVAGGWGGGEPAAIRETLVAVIDQFPPPAGEGESVSIRVRHRFGGPMINYDRETDGWLVVYLSARDSRVYQYVYQFAHEYCHVLAHFDRKLHGDDIVREQQWFEESLCETASLYALQSLATRWCAEQRGSPARDAGEQLAQYLQQLLAEPHRKLAAGRSMADWFDQNQSSLRREPYLRELNELAAAQLLPLFEKEPAGWTALLHLHPSDGAPIRSFADLLTTWRAAAPPQARPLVDAIQSLFGLASPTPSGRDTTTTLASSKPACGR